MLCGLVSPSVPPERTSIYVCGVLWRDSSVSVPGSVEQLGTSADGQSLDIQLIFNLFKTVFIR